MKAELKVKNIKKKNKNIKTYYVTFIYKLAKLFDLNDSVKIV